WWRHLAGARRLSLLTVRRQGRLIALAPLAVRPRSLRRLLPWPGLELLGTGIAGSDYLDLIVRRGHEREALAALADALVADNLVLELTQLPPAGGAGGARRAAQPPLGSARRLGVLRDRRAPRLLRHGQPVRPRARLAAAVRPAPRRTSGGRAARVSIRGHVLVLPGRLRSDVRPTQRRPRHHG